MNKDCEPEFEKKAWPILEKLASASLEEQKKARKWSILFKCLTFLYLFFILFAFWPGNEGFFAENKKNKKHVALVNLLGVIAQDQPANANAMATALREAFKNENSVAVIISINSPGGSPVQSAYMYNEINRLEAKYPDKPVYAVISDIGASGAYYVAAAAKEIYANESSLVGSIGVISAGFGFPGAMQKLGVDRRVYTSGEHKAFLDPYSSEKQEEITFWKGVLNSTHQTFIDAVKAGRGERLQEENTFSGLIWSGKQALDKGLIDGFASVGQLAREKFDTEDVVNYTVSADPISRLLKKFSAEFDAKYMQSVMQPNLY